MAPIAQFPQPSAERAPSTKFLAKGPLWTRIPAFRTLQNSSQSDETQASASASGTTAEAHAHRSAGLNFPPIITPDRIGTTRVLLQDTQACIQKFSARMDVLDTRVERALQQLELSRGALEAGNEKIVSDLSDIVYKCHADNARDNGVLRRELEKANEKISYLNVLYDAQAANISSLTLASHTQANASQSLQAQQAQLATAIAVVEPIIRILPAQHELATEKMGAALHTMVQSAVDSAFEKLSARIIATFAPVISNAINASARVPDYVQITSLAKRKRDAIDERSARCRSNSIATTTFAHASYTSGPGVSPQITRWSSGILATANKRRCGSFRCSATEAIGDLEHHRSSPFRFPLAHTDLSDHMISSPTRRRASKERQRSFRHYNPSTSVPVTEQIASLSAASKRPMDSLVYSGVNPGIERCAGPCLFDANVVISSAPPSINVGGLSDLHVPACTVRASRSVMSELRSAYAAQKNPESVLMGGTSTDANTSSCGCQGHAMSGGQSETTLKKAVTNRKKGRANDEPGPKKSKTKKPEATSSSTSVKVPAKKRGRPRKSAAATALTKPLPTTTTTSNSIIAADVLTSIDLDLGAPLNVSVANQLAPRELTGLNSPSISGTDKKGETNKLLHIVEASSPEVRPGNRDPSSVPQKQDTLRLNTVSSIHNQEGSAEGYYEQASQNHATLSLSMIDANPVTSYVAETNDGGLSAALAHIDNDIDFVNTMGENKRCKSTGMGVDPEIRISGREKADAWNSAVEIIDDDELGKSISPTASGIDGLLDTCSTGILTSSAKTKRYLVMDGDSTDVDLLFDDILVG